MTIYSGRSATSKARDLHEIQARLGKHAHNTAAQLKMRKNKLYHSGKSCWVDGEPGDVEVWRLPCTTTLPYVVDLTEDGELVSVDFSDMTDRERQDLEMSYTPVDLESLTALECEEIMGLLDEAGRSD